jgi:hypothetical protein
MAEPAADPALSGNPSGFQDAPAAPIVVFSAIADAPVLGGAEDGECRRTSTGLGGPAGDRHRGAAAVPYWTHPRRDPVHRLPAEGPESGVTGAVGQDTSAGWATVLREAGTLALPGAGDDLSASGAITPVVSRDAQHLWSPTPSASRVVTHHAAESYGTSGRSTHPGDSRYRWGDYGRYTPARGPASSAQAREEGGSHCGLQNYHSAPARIAGHPAWRGASIAPGTSGGGQTAECAQEGSRLRRRQQR